MSINADIGEGFGRYSLGDDAQLMGVLTDVNIACGFHAGDPSIMRRSVDRAVAHDLGIGAHVSYPDLRGFGRREMHIPAETVYDDVIYQLGALRGVADTAGGRVSYVKPHGALYQRAWTDVDLAEAIARATRDVDPNAAVLCPAGSALAVVAARRGLIVVREAFVDRGYRADGHLLPRDHDGALLNEPDRAGAQARLIATEGRVIAADGAEVLMPADSLCIHSDSPGAVGLARAARDALERAGVRVRSFAGCTT